jgi:hypothetical protein
MEREAQKASSHEIHIILRIKLLRCMTLPPRQTVFQLASDWEIKLQFHQQNNPVV